MISIVIALYNKENSIKKTIDSILSQKQFDDYEIIVVDDGSTDNSYIVVESYNCDKIKLYKKENGGPASARNYGVRKATGHWIIFMDADDFFLPDALKIFSSLSEKHREYQCFCCNYMLVEKEHLFKRTYIMPNGRCFNPYKKWLTRQFSPRAGAAMYHKEVLLKHSFNENLRRFEDAQVSFDIMREYKFFCCNKPVMVYNCDTIAASRPRNDPNEDFLSCLNINNKSFWERVALYSFYKKACLLYPEYAKNMYKTEIYDKIAYKIALRYIVLYHKIDNILRRIIEK